MGKIRDFLQQRESEGLLRKLKPSSSRKNGNIFFGDRGYVDLSSNDYLGLASHPKLIAAGKRALDEFGSGSGASRLLSGDLSIHHELETAIAHFKNKEAALVFNSGYQANVGIFNSICGKDDCIFSDRLNHASIVDGLQLCRAKTFRFRHNDINDLECLLKRERLKFKKAIIVTETIFSMDGDAAPLEALVDLKERYDCLTVVDEAHATGIYGKNGSGMVEKEGLSDRIDIIMGTFGKALGSFGAYVAASKDVIEYLVNTCRSFIYSTGLPPSVIACNLASLELIRDEPYRREELVKNAVYLRGALKDIGLNIIGSSQIVPMIVGENKAAQNLAKELQLKGWWALPIRPPTVPEGQARLRFSLTFDHSLDTLNRLIKDLSDVRI
ncbi:MAG: 8-amino-7-oxononanoate synthase [Candidatus Omnitrophota bacterium]|nr:8-amino-7-oxononanoate synthase [Candidatus Omnitrophota bacterium]